MHGHSLSLAGEGGAVALLLGLHLHAAAHGDAARRRCRKGTLPYVFRQLLLPCLFFLPVCGNLRVYCILRLHRPINARVPKPNNGMTHCKDAEIGIEQFSQLHMMHMDASSGNMEDFSALMTSRGMARDGRSLAAARSNYTRKGGRAFDAHTGAPQSHPLGKRARS